MLNQNFSRDEFRATASYSTMQIYSSVIARHLLVIVNWMERFFTGINPLEPIGYYNTYPKMFHLLSKKIIITKTIALKED